MPNNYLGKNVYDRALERIEEVYREGRRVVVSLSGGKDSTVVLELALIVARKLGRLPVEAMCRDEEILFPGTYEYVERVHRRSDVDLTWAYSVHAIPNAFSRVKPFWWTFDPTEESKWVRPKPALGVETDHVYLDNMFTVGSYPQRDGKTTAVLTGIRTSESMNRRMSVYSSKGARTKERGAKDCRTIQVRPIFDWKDSDVWLAINSFGWDYNKAYNAMHRLGCPKSRLRIAPPTVTYMAYNDLQIAIKAWPKWFEKVAARLTGVRTAAMFGKRALTADRRLGETWQECYIRTCVENGPQWIRERATKYMEDKMRGHRYHSNHPIPDTVRCPQCVRNGCWKRMLTTMFMGDPYGLKDVILNAMKPEDFLPGGKWFSKD